MNQLQFKTFSDKIKHYISARRISSALNALGQLLDEVIAPWEMREQLGRLRESYRYLAQYALDGIADPARQEVYDGIVNGISDIVGRVRREVLMYDNPSLYFSTMRYEAMQHADTMASLVKACEKAVSDLQMASLTAGDEGVATPLRAALEQAEKRLFNRIWVTYPLSSDDAATLRAFMTDELVEPTTRMLLVSAMLMALLANYDERMMYLLTYVYFKSVDTRLQMRALTALLIAMSIYRDRRPGKHLRELLDTVRDQPSWTADVNLVFKHFIRSRDTEKINRKMETEVIPEMLKLRPDIYKKINENPEAAADINSIEENPEWQEMLDKSGLTEKMRELQEMQEEGADVLMSTFSHLKTFPFFNDVANWFLPYRSDHSAVAAVVGGMKFAEILSASSFLCDSDKYSVMLSVSRMSGAQLDMVTSQFDMQNINLQEIKAASLAHESAERDDEARRYVQTLYRFFKLFRRKGEFNDPFVTSLNLATVPLLSDIFDNVEHLSMIAEFYFQRGYYDDALALFAKLTTMSMPTASIYQKMGYARQRQGDMEGALDCYRQADLLGPDDLWTLRRLASCYRALGKPSDALDCYTRIASRNPDDLNIALHMGHCYLELGKYSDAIKQYFKVEFLDKDSTRALRPIAWCSFLAGDYERARDYFDRIPADTLTAGDHLNRGHLEMATGHYRKALDHYGAARETMDDWAKFSSAMQSDLRYLRAAGVEDFMTGIVLDDLMSRG